MSGLRRGKRVYTFPHAVDDNNDVKPEEFQMAATRGNHQSVTAYHQSHPYENAPPKPTGIPLKCDQEFSHVDGAALFNAPVAAGVDKLTTPDERGVISLRKRFGEYDVRNNTPKETANDYVRTVRDYREPPKIHPGGVPEPQAEYNRLENLEVMMRSRG
jgi:hypothetical protein